MNADRIHAAAFGASLLIHGACMMQFGGDIGSESPSALPSTVVTRLSFSQPALMPEASPEAQPETAIETPPEPEVRKESAKSEKIVAKKKQPPEPKRKPQKAAPVAAVPAAASAAQPQIDPGLIVREKERYLASVMAHVEKHKHYPKTARRRGIQGEVSVRFVLYADGSARNIEAGNGPELLLHAAQETIQHALPLPSPPASIPCPLPCHFRIRFSLDAD